MAKSRRVSRKERKSRKATREGRKASRKTRRALSSWNVAVMRVYKEMKAKDKNVKFGAALKEASRRKKAGKL